MTKDPDLARLDEILDPFTGAAMAPIRPQDTRSMGLAPSRSSAKRTRGMALGAVLLFEGAWLVFVEHRPDLTSAPPLWLAARAAGPLAAAALAFWAATRPGPRGLGEPVQRLALVALAVPALFVVHTLVLARADGHDAGYWHHVFVCFALAGVLAAAPLLAGAWALRRSFVAAPGWRTATLGMACGALAATTMSLACGTESTDHVLMGHGAVIVLGALAGALLGGRVTRA